MVITDIEYLSQTEFFVADEGHITFRETKIKPIFIYILFNGDIPIYVGQSTNIKTRVKKHREGNNKKVFDKCYLVSHCYSDHDARFSERSVISAMRLINPNLLNKATTGYNLLVWGAKNV